MVRGARIIALNFSGTLKSVVMMHAETRHSFHPDETKGIIRIELHRQVRSI